MNHLILGQRRKIRMKQEIKTYYGIADAHGIESFFTEEEMHKTKFPYVLRADLNRQRHAVFYEVELLLPDVEVVKQLIKKGKYQESLQFIKKNLKKLSFPKAQSTDYGKSWKLIPNPDLDPGGKKFEE